MKFLSNLGSCYRPTGLPPAEVSASSSSSSSTTTQMALTCKGGGDGDGNGSCSKRIKKVAARSSVAHWRPALSVISEDGVVSVFESDQRKAQPEKKSSSRSTAKTRCFRSNDEYDNSRKSSMPMILPAFSPTPFMF